MTRRHAMTDLHRCCASLLALCPAGDSPGPDGACRRLSGCGPGAADAPTASPHPAALQHGQGRMWCLDCHLGNDRDVLHGMGGQRIGFNDSSQLCALASCRWNTCCMTCRSCGN
jgi:hypothetical protein